MDFINCCSAERAMALNEPEEYDNNNNNKISPQKINFNNTTNTTTTTNSINTALEDTEGTTTGGGGIEWLDDSEAPYCFECNIKFTTSKRKHHCRRCCKISNFSHYFYLFLSL